MTHTIPSELQSAFHQAIDLYIIWKNQGGPELTATLGGHQVKIGDVCWQVGKFTDSLPEAQYNVLVEVMNGVFPGQELMFRNTYQDAARCLKALIDHEHRVRNALGLE